MSIQRKILIIGGVAAGTTAASKARRIDSNADIKIIQEEPYVAYGSCGIPYVIEGKINNFNKLIARSIEEFKTKYNIEIFVNTKAVKIEPCKKYVLARNLKNKRTKIFHYDSLIIATGARSVIPKVKGLSIDNHKKITGIFFLRNFEDGIKIYDYLKNVK